MSNAIPNFFVNIFDQAEKVISTPKYSFDEKIFFAQKNVFGRKLVTENFFGCTPIKGVLDQIRFLGKYF